MCKTNKQGMIPHASGGKGKVYQHKRTQTFKKEWKNPLEIGRAQKTWTSFELEIVYNILYVSRPAFMSTYSSKSYLRSRLVTRTVQH
jgi:hypothetical protein